MDELIDLLDSHGNHSTRTALKSEAHKKGWFHPTVHIWFYTKNQKILIQKRSQHKDTYPSLWDVSVAGHIGAGETIEDAAIREIAEEIGLQISKQELKKIGVFKAVAKHREDLIDCEFHHTYIVELKTPLEKLTKQESEVDDLQLISLLEFSEEVWGLANTKKYVPHDTNYYKTVIKAIKKAL